ncbi:MAG: FprA family A-type flavoprotein [Promethearchaeota archaeon]
MLQKILDEIYSVGVKDWDRRLFDELIPLPDGTSYNAYIIKGKEKIALIDTVEPIFFEELFKNLKQMNLTHLDYVIINHAEGDHAGSLPQLLENYPELKAVTNQKCKEIIMALMHIPEERIMVIDDGDILDLGDITLQFLMTPWVHWPETMLTYIPEKKILFPCDFFGSHLATSELYVNDNAKFLSAAKRYYAEIMMPFRKLIQKYLKKLEDYEIEIIAPSHGPLQSNPSIILDAYKDWTSDEVKNEVAIPYISMYGSTEKLVLALVDKLIERGITVKPYRITRTDIGELAMGLVDVATIVIGSPTVLGGPHPVVAYAAILANAIRPKAKFASIIGSYGWKGQMVEQIAGMIGNLNVEVLPPVVINGKPREADYKEIERLAEDIYNKHKELGIL